MHAILLTIGGALLGILLTIIYEKVKEKGINSETRRLLLREIQNNLKALDEVLSVIRDLSVQPLPSFIKPLTIEEIANRVEKACQCEAFDASYQHIPCLGTEAMSKVFLFYDGFRQVPHSFREIERFGGNIRAGLFEDYIQDLIQKGQNAINAITN